MGSLESRHRLPDWPDTRPVPDELVRVVVDLFDSKAQVVTLDDLSGYPLGDRSPEQAAQNLRRAGWIFPLRCRGAWWFARAWPPIRTSGFMELRARLRVRPDTPACIGGKSVAQANRWLRRPTGPRIGMPPRAKVPGCLDGYTVHRWAPQIPLDEIDGLPVWKPETLVVYMGARPVSFSWEDIAEWLWQACECLNEDLLLAELEGRPRAVWMKTAYIIEAGERPDLSDVLQNRAPTNAKGPYEFGKPRYPQGPLKRAPIWSATYEVIDHVFPYWWMEKWR